MQQITQLIEVMLVGRGGDQAVGQATLGIDTNVGLHAKVPLIAFLGLMHLRIAFLYLLYGVGGSAAISLAGVLYSFEGSMCGLFGLMAASAVVKYVQKQDIRADIVLLTMFIIWAIVVGSNTWVADIGAVVVGAVSGWAWLQTRWSSYRRQLGAGLAVLAVCLVALVVTWVM